MICLMLKVEEIERGRYNELPIYCGGNLGVKLLMLIMWYKKFHYTKI